MKIRKDKGGKKSANREEQTYEIMNHLSCQHACNFHRSSKFIIYSLSVQNICTGWLRLEFLQKQIFLIH